MGVACIFLRLVLCQLLNLLLFFFFFGRCWVFIILGRFCLIEASRGYSSLQCMDLQWLLLLWSTGSWSINFSNFSMCTQWLQPVGSRELRLQQLWHTGSVVVTCRL